MKLHHLLKENHIILDLQATDHWGAICELVSHLFDQQNLGGVEKDVLLQSLRLREEQVSTGIGFGVAIPHTFSEELDHVVAVLGRSKNGIDFQSLDGNVVHLIILFIVPSKEYHLHLRTLAAIAKSFTDQKILNLLLVAETPSEVLDILEAKPNYFLTKEDHSK